MSAFWNFLILKRADQISWRAPILQNSWIIWSLLLYFNIRNLKDRNSSSFMRCECILHDSGVIFSAFWSFLKLKRGDLSSWGGNQICRTAELFGPLLYLNFRNMKDPNSLSFIRYQCIIHDSAIFFYIFWNVHKLNRGNQFFRTTELFSPSFFISVLEIWRTQTLCHSSDINAFYMIQQYFSQLSEISSN